MSEDGIELGAYRSAKEEYEQAMQEYKTALAEAEADLRELHKLGSLQAELTHQRRAVELRAAQIRQVEGLKTITCIGGTVVVADLSKLVLEEPEVITYIRSEHPNAADSLIKERINFRPFKKWWKGQLAAGQMVPGVKEEHSWSVRITLDQS